MSRKLASSTLIVAVTLLLATAGTFAAPKPTNEAPVVTAFDVPDNSASPIPVLTFTATDSDGTVAGYLITETSTKPGATAAGWSATKPAEYTTSSVGTVTLYAWAKDDKDTVSNSRTDTVTVPRPPINADTLDGKDSTEFAAATHDHDATYSRRYANVVVVAKGGGDFSDPVAAMNSITDQSAEKPYLVKIMPGVYDLGTTTLMMKEYVDIEGSGEKVTVLQGMVDCPSIQVGLIQGPTNSSGVGGRSAELRHLTVANVASGASTIAISNYYAALTLSHVTVKASGGTTQNIGVVNDFSGSAMRDVTVEVSGANAVGVLNQRNNGHDAFNVTMKDVSIGVTGDYTIGVRNYWSVWVDMTDVTITSSGRGVIGIANNLNANVSLSNVRITASGEESAYGVTNSTYGILTVNSSTIAASGPIWNCGIEFSGGSTYGAGLGITDSIVTASGGTENYGLRLNSAQWTTVDRSSLDGSTLAFLNTSADPLLARIAATKLVGPVSGFATCVGAYSGDYAPLGVNCQ